MGFQELGIPTLTNCREMGASLHRLHTAVKICLAHELWDGKLPSIHCRGIPSKLAFGTRLGGKSQRTLQSHLSPRVVLKRGIRWQDTSPSPLGSSFKAFKKTRRIGTKSCSLLASSVITTCVEKM